MWRTKKKSAHDAMSGHLLLLLLLLLRTFKGDLLLKIIFVEMMMERRLDVETFYRFPETLFNRFR